jgi:hypothetical protein
MTVTQTTETAAVDRYITLVDRAAHEPEALRELGSEFARRPPCGSVNAPVTGLAEITEFRRRFCSDMADSKYVWTTTVLDGGTIEVRFIAAWRTTDGKLGSQGGVEHVTVDADGLITKLRVLSAETDGA